MPDLKAEKNGVGMGEVEENQKVSKIRGLFILFTKVLFLYANYWFNHLAAARLEAPARILCPHHLTIFEQ